MMNDLTVSRRSFVKIGGALFVTLGVEGSLREAPLEAASKDPDPSQLSAWLEIHEDGTIIARTGKTETGTSSTAFFEQIVAEELDVPAMSVTLVRGHTDETPDGGFSAGYLHQAGNLRKVAAYTRQALLEMAAPQLGASAAALTVADGVISGGGKKISYGDLVKGRKLTLTIPVQGGIAEFDAKNGVGIANLGGFMVTGNPPTKNLRDYKVIGTNHPRRSITDIVVGKGVFSGDVVLPGMLHARMVRPATIGSTLKAAGKLDRAKFPTAEVVVKGNLVAVVSPDEWEALQGARAVASTTEWTPWSGMPVGKSPTEMVRAAKPFNSVGKKGDAAAVDALLASAAKVVSATYEGPYVKPAPIGGYVALADVKQDGTTTVWVQSAHPSGLRANVAHTLGVPLEKVRVRCELGPGQYGRTTLGGDGAAADAGLLSQLLGKPVRVQWTLSEDLVWSSFSPPWYADVKAGLDAKGNLVAFRLDWYGGHENDARLLGGILAGAPTLSPQPVAAYGAALAMVWPYDKTPMFAEAFFTQNLLHDTPNGGLRGNMMRTPQQRQQNVALEGIMTEAAAAAGVDQVEFRRRHTSDVAYARLLDEVSAAHKYQPRPSPNPQQSGATLTGRGVGVVVRDGAPWVTIADVAVNPSTGVVQLTAYTVGVDVGKVMNPRHLKSNIEGGAVMGIGEALFEEVTFDASKVTSADWNGYRIPRTKDLPEIKVVFTSREDRGLHGGGEAANSAAPPAIMAAFFDATGVMPRRIPLTPAYVKELLK